MSLAGIVLIGAALLASAAGPSSEKPRLSKPAYEQKVRTAYAGVQSAFLATRGKSGRELAEKIGLAQQALRQAADELSQARPPEPVELHNRDLAEGMREYAAALDAAIRAAENNDQQAMSRFHDASTHSGVRKMRESAKKMKRIGYHLGPIAGGS